MPLTSPRGIRKGATPLRRYGGIAYGGHTAGVTASVINSRYTTTSPFTIATNFSLSPNRDSIYCHATITASMNYSGGSLVAHMAVVERNIYFASAPGSNGEKHFEGVMKRMLPSDQGTAITNTWLNGDAIDLKQFLHSVFTSLPTRVEGAAIFLTAEAK